MKRGGPASERSRHIDIRHFWLNECAEMGEVANLLTKFVQGAQFVKERFDLTNWNYQ